MTGPGLMRLPQALWRWLTSPAYRSYARLRWHRPPALFQLSSTTREDRYPGLFQFAQNEMGKHSPVRILSFGCSTGEEVFTLRRYFPQASLRGLDINAASIARAQQRLRHNSDSSMAFERAGSTSREPSHACDAIFCLAVFREGALADPRFERCDSLITFQRFSAAVDDIARCLKPGGLLFLAHVNFRFADTAAARQFDLVHRMDFAGANAGSPLFDASNRRTSEVNGEALVFRKKRPAAVGPGNAND